jgi:hypothetical protein
VKAASIVMKFDPDGNLRWRHVYESSFDGSYTKKCLVDADDNVYVLGMGHGPAGFVTKVKKFGPDGTALWSYFDADGIGAPVNFKFTPDGFIVIAARSIYGSINGYAKIDLGGNKVWSYPGVFSLTVGDAAGDLLGHTYLVHGENALNPRTVIKKLDPSAALVWENLYALAGFRVEVGTDGRAVVSGFPNAGSGGAAFIKIDQGGGLICANLDADGPLALLLHAQMLLDASNNAYLAAGTLFEMAVCKVNSDGTSAWTATTTGGYAYGVALGQTADTVFVVGGATARLSEPSAGDPPSAPSGLTASSLTATSVDLLWVDNATNESGTVLERCTGTLAFCEAHPEDFAVQVTLGPDVTEYTDAPLLPGTNYAWRLRAFNAAGSSSYSNVLSLTTPAAPAAPTNLRARARLVRGQVQIRLTWTDNAADETGYVVERCVGGGCTDLAPVASLAANSVAYTDRGVARATTYRYRVMVSGSSGAAAYSTTVQVTTP